MRKMLERRPLLACGVLALAIGGLAALLVLPRLDAVEIRAAAWARPERAGAPPVIVIDVDYRLASAPAGSLAVGARGAATGKPWATTEVSLRAGRHRREVRLEVAAPTDPLAIAVELRPGGAGDGLLDRLQAGRRRDLTVLPPPPAPPSVPAGEGR